MKTTSQAPSDSLALITRDALLRLGFTMVRDSYRHDNARAFFMSRLNPTDIRVYQYITVWRDGSMNITGHDDLFSLIDGLTILGAIQSPIDTALTSHVYATTVL